MSPYRSRHLSCRPGAVSMHVFLAMLASACAGAPAADGGGADAAMQAASGATDDTFDAGSAGREDAGRVPDPSDDGDDPDAGADGAAHDAGMGGWVTPPAEPLDAGVAAPDGGRDAGGASAADAGADAAAPAPMAPAIDPYASQVVAFSPGAHAGFGEADFPEVVLGPPMGLGSGSGSLDVLSLGVGGEIVLGFEAPIVDGWGADFVVFENAFWPGGLAGLVFAEPGEVAVSDDGSTWHSFPCQLEGDAEGTPGVYPGCAGWTPALAYDPATLYPLDPALTGGDAFDLADLGLTRARFVRIRDLSTSGEGNTAGFDLDAVGIVHQGQPGLFEPMGDAGAE